MPLTPEQSWAPILEGDLADRAWQAVRDICDALAAHRPEGRQAADDALFWAYAAGAFDDETTHQRLEMATEQLVSWLDRGYRSLALYGGLSGAGWVAQHLAPEDDDNDELYTIIDDAVMAGLSVDTWGGDYELITGLVGYGVYFVERARSPKPGPAVDGLARIVHHLDELAERNGDEISWYTPADKVLPGLQTEAPRGYHNLGLAHGVPGIIALLGLVQASPARSEQARQLACGAVRWLVRQRIEGEPGGIYPKRLNGRPPTPARTAWCYGDPGIAAALWSSASRVQGQTWKTEAIEVARYAAQRRPELCGVKDPSLCHGAAGLAHIYSRFFHASGDPVFRHAAERWFEATLDLRRPGEGVGGILEYTFRGGRETWEPRASFLQGAVGVGLALLGGLGAYPGWDRLLLCDVPTQHGDGGTD